jgi:allantoinase
MYDLLLTGAQVVLEREVVPLTIAVQGGKIAALLLEDDRPPAKLVLDYSGKMILPGALDTHSHVSYCGDFLHGTQTAASGGVTTILEMPLSLWLPAATTEETFEERIKLVEKEAYTDVALWGGAQPDMIDGIQMLEQKGACAYKVFTNYVGEEYKYFDDYHLLCLMEAMEKLGGVIGIHAENDSICAGLVEKFRAEGRGVEFHPKSRPPISEYEAVSRVCLFALETGCRIHLCHISVPESIDIIDAARARGAKITLETCPQYLSLSQEEVAATGNYGKFNPPARDAASQAGVWSAILRGRVDCIGSDHSAYSEAQKEGKDFWSAPGGCPGMDLMFPVLISEGIHKRGLSWPALARMMSTNPASIFGLSHCKGAISVGLDADFAVIDPHHVWTYHAKETFYHTKSPHYPFEGHQFQGAVHATFVRGKLVYQEGEIRGEQGWGKFISAKHAI